MIGDHVTEKELPLNIAHCYAQAHPGIDTRPVPVQTGMRSLEEIEKEAVIATLRATHGNKSETARRWGSHAKHCTIN